MDIRQLRYFVAIVELGSFSKAARVLRIAQPALSTHIRNMEEELGTVLLNRIPQGARATEAGKILLDDSRGILLQFETTIEKLRGYEAEPLGRVAVRVPSLLDAEFAATLLTRARSLFPKIEIDLVEATIDHRSLAIHQSIDIAITHADDAASGWQSEKILDERLLLVGRGVLGIRLDENGCVPFESLCTLPLVLPRHGHPIRDLVDTLATMRGGKIDASFETDSYACLLALVQQGGGFAVFPESAVQRQVADGSLLSWVLVDPIATFSTLLTRRVDTLNQRAIDAVAALCRSTFTALLAAPSRH